MLVGVEEDVEIGTMWDFAFPVAAVSRPVFPGAPDIKVRTCSIRSHHTANHPFIFTPSASSRFPRADVKMGGQFALLGFPVEIICHILSFVSYRDLISSTLVCHSELP
jgi:hypothetical protein